MTSIFDAYDQEFNNISSQIQRNNSELKSYSSSSNQETCNSLIRQIEGLLGQANDLVKQMNVEVRSHDAATRKVLTEKVTQYSKSLSSLRSDFERAREQAQRSSLIGEKSLADRQKMLDVNDKLSRQNEMILNAQRTVAETEEVGIEITNELVRNREKIESAHQKVTDFAGVTDTARRLLTSMSRRDVQQRFILFFIAAVLIIAIALTIYYTTNKSSSN